MKRILARIPLALVAAGMFVGVAACEEETPIDERPGPAGPVETPEVPPGTEVEEPGPAGPIETPEVAPEERDEL